MQIPAYLKKGDTVAIIATARKISEEEIKPAIALRVRMINVLPICNGL